MIGFDIGGTKCAVSTGHTDGEKLVIDNKRILVTEHDISPYEMIEKMCRAAEEMTHDFSRIGISCGGPLDSKRGIIMSPPNLPGWDNVKICEFVKNRCGSDVYLQNDANACAVAEWKFGAGRGCNNMIFLTFGTGLGAGLILDGRLYTGANDMAGEVGHIRISEFGPVGYGKSGSFEGFCSGGGIKQLGISYATEKLQMGKKVSFCDDLSGLDDITAKKIAEAAVKGYEDAISVYRLCGKMLGKGLSILVDILNPERIVIGSIYQRCEQLICESMNEVMERESLSLAYNNCKVIPAELCDNIGDYAALSVALTEE